MLVVCRLQPAAASVAALFEASSSATFCLASASPTECIQCGSKKISYNCNYTCKQTAMLVVCGLQPAAASAAALFEASSSADICLASTSAAEFIRCDSKKISYNCNYKCKQTAMLVVCGLQPAATKAAALFEASSSAAFFFCSSAFRFTSATDFIIYCSKKVKFLF
jgi:hypothetical protein